MNVTTDQRSDGTWSATITPAHDAVAETCTHAHGSEGAARACGNWESRAVARGETRWHAGRARARTSHVEPITLGSGDEIIAGGGEDYAYVPSAELVALERAMAAGAKKRVAGNAMFLGPSGSGKTEGARDFAKRLGLPFTKVDAASMTDPDSWFGTREIVVQDGVAVTDYRPSEFVQALTQPGVTLIDEVTRVDDRGRQVLLPILDKTRAVTNPLTGDVVERHPRHFIIMAGNVGMQFTGTSAMDPAFMTRAHILRFDYIDAKAEKKIVAAASGCDEDTAEILVKFAHETRMKARNDPEFTPISTRELIEAARLVADGLDRDLAVKFEILNGVSDEGGTASVAQELQNIWNGVRVLAKNERDAGKSMWLCPAHGKAKIVPAGTSKATGKTYASFRACPVYACGLTEDKTAFKTSTP